MRKTKIRRIERIEHYLVRIIQQPGADQGHPWPVRWLLAVLKGLSQVFKGVVLTRLFFYNVGIFRRYPLGCQVVSVGNITAGGTGKTPVVEIFARELQKSGRRVAILSRGYRKKELPWYQRLFRETIEPPRVVSDGKRLLLDSELGGDEPYMLASNLPGVVVLVDKNRVKSGRYAVKRFNCDTLILDDGFQYQKLRHRLEIVLVDQTNPFGNAHLLPRGVLREPIRNIRRADFIFITKSNGHSEALRRQLRALNDRAEIIECCHQSRFLQNVYTAERVSLDWLKGRTVTSLSGIAVPQSFENSLRVMGARVVHCERYADHHRYSAQEIIDAVNKAADLRADALMTTEKDAVRFPRLETTPVPVYYLRVDIELLSGAENFHDAVERICFSKGKRARGAAGPDAEGKEGAVEKG
ncbi:MAG: tetraacyldisaccharide 4'-kinase [Verrucomicrobiota bacterium]|jgi:tetraacyldisaccharide 4'-kinase|nr:tetraacyldisaccharide 4'-kinase [Verrucomicrobiota bacterium]